MNKRIILFFAGLFVTFALCAQGSRNLKITEVVTANTNGLVDEYGQRSAWIEITNTSWTTVDVRSCYLTTDRRALDRNLSVPERVKLMSVVVKGDEKTSLAAQERIVFFADGQTNLGTLHMNFVLEPGEETFIALFDGNGETLIDSLTVPALEENCSYARIFGEDAENEKWLVLSSGDVTPGYPNRGQEAAVDKVAEFKEKDPYGVALSVIAMSIVFGCLAFLYVFFRIFGWFMLRLTKLARVKAIRKIRESANKVAVIAKDGLESKGVDMTTYMAVIGMALHEYENDVHDVESNILTLHQEEHTDWNSKDKAMHEWHK